MNRPRLTVYPIAFLAGLSLFWLLLMVSGDGLLDGNGEPIGADFLAFYSASSLARDGGATSVYDADTLHDEQARIVGGGQGTAEWRYPPVYLLLVMPLSLLPYVVALAGWIAAGGLAMFAAVRRISTDYLAVLLVAASPAFYRTYSQGQNGFLTAALLGFGLTLLRKRPVAAGLILGLLTYKPHFAVLVFVALAVAKEWRALGAATASATIAVLIGLVAFGPDAYREFFRSLQAATDAVYQVRQDLRKMHSFSSTMLLLGFSAPVSQCVQVVVSLAAGATALWVWTRSRIDNLCFAALVLGTLAVSPYFFDYDLIILALAVLWLALDGMQRGWLQGDLELLLLTWWTPFFATALVLATSVMITPFVIALLLLMTVRRARFEPPGPTPSPLELQVAA